MNLLNHQDYYADRARSAGPWRSKPPARISLLFISIWRRDMTCYPAKQHMKMLI